MLSRAQVNSLIPPSGSSIPFPDRAVLVTPASCSTAVAAVFVFRWLPPCFSFLWRFVQERRGRVKRAPEERKRGSRGKGLARKKDVPSPSLSKRRKASLNSAICSSESWVAVAESVIVALLGVELEERSLGLKRCVFLRDVQALPFLFALRLSEKVLSR